MDSKKVTALSKVIECIKLNQNFVLQGGAGSGKTETLKKVLEYILIHFPNKKITCITHTNLAVEEITSRIREVNLVSTIHSFLNTHTKNYKKNIHEVIPELFRI